MFDDMTAPLTLPEALERIKELELAECKTHIAMTMQMPCDACGRMWSNHWKRVRVTHPSGGAAE